MTPPQHLAIISYHTCPLASQEGKESGGMNVYVLEVAKELAKKGYYVDVFTRIQDEISPEIVDFAPRLKVIHLKAGPKAYVPKKNLYKYVSEFSHEIDRYLTAAKTHYVAIHAHYYLSGLAGLYLKAKYSIPLVISFHTLALMKNLVARNSKEKETMMRINGEKKLVSLSDKIIASSDNDKKYLASLYDCPQEKIHVVSPGVDTSLFRPLDKNLALNHIQSHTQDKIILFVGRIEPLKGIDVLMYALKIYLHNNPDSKVKLLIVGSREEHHTNQELKRLKKLQKTLGISPVVGFINQRPQHELPYYYNAAEIVVMPSHYESFGMTALEAMACGTSVITTDTTGISGLLDGEFDNIIISANNPLLLANQFESVINDQKKHEELRSKILDHVKHMTWDKVAEKITKVYTSLF